MLSNPFKHIQPTPQNVAPNAGPAGSGMVGMIPPAVLQTILKALGINEAMVQDAHKAVLLFLEMGAKQDKIIEQQSAILAQLAELQHERRHDVPANGFDGTGERAAGAGDGGSAGRPA